MNPSIDFIHYNSRLDKNGILNKSGSINIRSAFKALKRYGVCHADTFPNNEFYDDITPGDAAYNEANLYSESFEYYRLYEDNDLSELRKCIASGFPVIFALKIFQSSGVKDGEWTHASEDITSIGSFAFVAVGYTRMILL